MRSPFKDAFLISLILLSLLQRGSMNPSDCWNEDKLNSMSADGDEHDKNLSKFNMMVKCLMQERSPGSSGTGGGGGIDWNQFNNIAQSGRFPKKKPLPPPPPPPPSYPETPDVIRRNRNRGGSVDYYDRGGEGSKKDWIRPGSRNPPPGGRNHQLGSQPRPGVHPEDWNEEGGVEDRRESRYNTPDNTPLWGQPSDHGYNNPPPKKEGGRKRGNNNRRNNNKDSKRMDMREENDLLGGVVGVGNLPPGPVVGPPSETGVEAPPSWTDGSQHRRPFEDENPFISADFGGDANLSLHRKYGYAVMAMSVVVLAVLMVSTIFCCNSSNSTMSQPAVAGIAQLDNYSLYSYKQGMVLPATTDTLRSGTIRSSMRTDTLRSSATTQQFRSSPQYRVSDIDPDFARRYKDENHY